MFQHGLSRHKDTLTSLAATAGLLVPVIGLSACGSSSSTSSAATTASNPRSGPAAGGSIGNVNSVSTSGFGLLTSAGEKVTVKQTSSTAYEKGTKSASARAVARGETVIVIGTTDSTTITATQVSVEPPSGGSTSSSTESSCK